MRAHGQRAPAAILACTETDVLALQISWDREGQLDALLDGDLMGTPREDCVRALVQQLSIPAPQTLGTIVHAIQR